MIVVTAGLVLFPLMMAYAAFSDLLTMTIPNKLTLALGSSYFLMALATGQPLDVILIHVLCGIGVLALAFVAFCFGWMGGGDAKLAAAVALWMGFPLSGEYLLISSFLGGLLTLVILFARKTPLPARLTNYGWLVRLHDAKTGIPYGIALAAGGLLLYTETSVWKNLAFA
jgi:prepilin peptidase CpaA